jgi:hypothetical protein
MIDFTLTEMGDIDLAPARQYPSFTINMHVSKLGNKDRRFPGLRIDFDTDIKQYDISKHDFKINFYTDRIQTKTKISAPPVCNNEELAQEISIRLKTELGEFPFIPNLGSQLVLERHEDIRSDTVLENTKRYTEEAIADIDFPDDYTVSVERIDDTSRFRYETLRITIDTGQTQAYESMI